MGKQEEESKKRTRRANLTKIILSTVQIAGLLSVAVVAPNVIGAMGKLGLIPNRRQGEFIKSSRTRLVRQGLLMYQGGLLRLTPAGERKLRRMELEDYGSRKQKRWDQKWRVLIFDIPEKRRGLRETVRRTLASIGFERLQDSVWVYPYDCEDLVTLLKADFHIGKDLLYLIVDSIENDRHLREEFGLS